MSLSQPKPPDPYVQSQIQTQFNNANLVNNALVNDVQQQTPYGSQTYQYAPGPNGVPVITATQAYTPQSNTLLNQFQGTQGQLAPNARNLINTGTNAAQGLYAGFQGIGDLGNTLTGYGKTLANNISGGLTQPPNFLAQSSPLVQAQMDAYTNYMAPFYKMQNSNSDSMLQNQGIPQGSQAWNNAKMGLNLSQNQGAQSALMQFEPQAFNQAVTNYALPIQTMGGLASTGAGLTGQGAQGVQGLLGTGANLASFAQPPGLNTTFYQQPQSGNAQPANYQTASQQQFQNQQNQFQNTIGDLGGLLGNLTGTGGLLGPLTNSIGNGISGLFGGLGSQNALDYSARRAFG